MSVTIKHPHGIVHVKQLQTGKSKISVKLLDDELFMPRSTCHTKYSLDLIEQIIEIKGPNWLCDELMRDEDPTYVHNYLRYAVLSYVKREEFNDKRLLDFGCGCGASTMVLGRIFPNTQIIGIDLVDEFVSLAKLKAKHHRFDNMSFLVSSEGCDVPDRIEDFDYIVLNAVYEHLLPDERSIVLPKIWSHLKLGGVMFINETPHRYFPIESHTSGLPMINYLPDKIALNIVRRLSKRVSPHVSWKSLLRMGIRGGTVKEILRILSRIDQKPILLRPRKLGIKYPSDIWFKASSHRKLSVSKRLMVSSLRVFNAIIGIPITPYLSLAIKKKY